MAVRSQASRSQVVVVAAGPRSEGAPPNKEPARTAKPLLSRPSQLSSHLLQKVRKRLGRRRQRRLGRYQQPHPSPLVLLHPFGTDMVICGTLLLSRSHQSAFLQRQPEFDVDRRFCNHCDVGHNVDMVCIGESHFLPKVALTPLCGRLLSYLILYQALLGILL